MHLEDKETVYAPFIKIDNENYAEKYVGYVQFNDFFLRPTLKNRRSNIAPFVCEGRYERHTEGVKVQYNIKPNPRNWNVSKWILIVWAVSSIVLSIYIIPNLLYGILNGLFCLLCLFYFLIMPYERRLNNAVSEFEKDLKTI
jgi:hypothetical protein